VNIVQTFPKSQKAATMPAEPASRPLRRYLRFSVRGLIVIALAIGAALGWSVRQAHLQRDAVAAIERAGGQAHYAIYPGAGDFTWTKPLSWNKLIGEYIGIDIVDHVAYVQFLERSNNNDAPRRQALAHLPDLGGLQTLNLAGSSIADEDLAGLEGLKHFERLMLQNTGIGDAGLAHVRALTSLQEIYIRNTPIGDEGLTHFRRLTNLRHLTLTGNKVTDAGIERLKNLRNLQTLDIAVTQISDGGPEHIAALSNLNILTLAWTRITDRGLAHLKRLTKLSSVDLTGTQVTDAGVKELMQALPRLTIER
jgi:hypothetical protein